ncbi:MAG: short-chain dehydrogenase [Minwuia thermotolerans]|nr:MAG: short-chain dehydrogenase [Minwuia thermotolerans]
MTGGEGGLAVITGGGSGIGAATALRLARRGLTVLINGRSAGRLDALAAAVVAEGGAVETVAADCGAPEGRQAILDAVAGRPVVAFIHSAGLDRIKPFEATTPEDFADIVAVNIAAPFFLGQALLPCLADGASITLVGSVSARHGLPRHALYGASKAALSGLTVNLASELAPRIRVNCVSPGGTNTAMLADFVQRAQEGLSEKAARRQHVAGSARMLLGRVAEPDEVAATIEHVALDASAMTGIDLSVDVGYSAS